MVLGQRVAVFRSEKPPHARFLVRSTMFEDIRKFQELRPTTVTGHMYTMITPEKAAAMGVASAQHAAGAKVRSNSSSHFLLPAPRM